MVSGKKCGVLSEIRIYSLNITRPISKKHDVLVVTSLTYRQKVLQQKLFMVKSYTTTQNSLVSQEFKQV